MAATRAACFRNPAQPWIKNTEPTDESTYSCRDFANPTLYNYELRIKPPSHLFPSASDYCKCAFKLCPTKPELDTKNKLNLTDENP